MKIQRKILFAFLLVFTISNTGLPMVLHYCTMGKKVKFDQCGMCSSHKKKHTAHGSAENFKAFSSKCCSTPISVSPIKEKYLQEKTDNQASIDQIALLAILQADNASEKSAEKITFLNNSPPGEGDWPLYIYNSVFRI